MKNTGITNNSIKASDTDDSKGHFRSKTGDTSCVSFEGKHDLISYMKQHIKE